MRVGYNAALLYSPEIRGWTRYAINLLEQLSRMKVEIFLYCQKPVHKIFLSRLEPGSYSVVQAPRMPYPIWESMWLPWRLQKDKIQLFHSLHNFGIPCVSPCPTVLTLHDAIDQIYYKSSLFSKSGAYHWLARKRADKIITVSEYSKKDLIRKLGIPGEKVTVIYEAADEVFLSLPTKEQCSGVRLKFNISRPYLFYVGGLEERKNLAFLIRAFSEGSSVEDLVIAGKGDNRFLKGLSEKLGVAQRCRFLGYVPDSDLPALYASSLAFIYPSKYEGFGLQVCEAMSVGCPVFVSDSSCLPEIVDGGGEVFSLSEISYLVDLIKRVTSDSSFRKDLSERALKRSESFSWKNAARETQAFYSLLISSKKG